MKQADVIIIGGGIAGCSAGAALAANTRVIVLEQETQPGYHATGRSAATLAPFYGPPAIRQLTAMSAPLLNSPPPTFSDRAFTSPRGEMMLVGNSKHNPTTAIGADHTTHSNTEETQAVIEESLAHGMHTISITDAMQMVALLKSDAIKQVLYTDKLLSIDVDALHQSYIRKIKKSGGEIICKAPVQKLHYTDKQWHVTTATEAHYQAPIVINAAGAWADEVAKMANLPAAGMQPRRRSAALLPYVDLPDSQSKMDSWPMLLDINERFYSIPFGSGLMVSPADETPVDAHDAWPEEIDLATGIDRFQQLIDYDVQTITHRWAGLRTFAADGDPVVGFDPLAQGFFWLAGQGGYGIQTSPALSELCAHIIKRYSNDNYVGSQTTEQDTAAFDRLEQQLSPARLSRS